jgi:hypothetical protein
MVEDPLTGIPAGMRDRIHVSDRGFVLHGSITADEQRVIQSLVSPKTHDPSHWQPVADSRGTMSWQFVDLKLPDYAGPHPDPSARGAVSSALRSAWQRVVSFVMLDWMTGRAQAASRFLVLGGAGCVVTQIATNTGCWSTTSGGASGASVPGAADDFIADGASGSGTGTLNGAMSFTNLTMTAFGGTVDANTFNFTISGNVNIGASAALKLGSGTHTIAGLWTNNSTASANWSPGTGTLSVTNMTGGTMTFAGANLSVNEFNNIKFARNVAAPATFTMSTRGLKWGGLLTITDTLSLTTLATSDLPLTGGNITIDNLGSMAANASTVSVVNVLLAGQTAGVLTLTTGQWTVSGNWDSSNTGAMFNAGSSTVTMTGSIRTVSLNDSTHGFDTLVPSGSILLNTTLWARILTVSGTLTLNSQSLVFKTLDALIAGTIVGASTVTKFKSDTSEAAARTTISAFPTWTNNTQYNWTHASSSSTTTITFTIGGNTATNLFNVLKASVAFKSGTVDGSGNVIFTMLGSDPAMQVNIVAPSGGGGTPVPSPTPTPATPAAVAFPWYTVFLVMTAIGAIIAFVAFLANERWGLRWGLAIMIMGIAGILLVQGYLFR